MSKTFKIFLIILFFISFAFNINSYATIDMDLPTSDEELETEDITSPSTTVTSISRNQGLTISDIINIILITIGILLIFLAITILIKLK